MSKNKRDERTLDLALGFKVLFQQERRAAKRAQKEEARPLEHEKERRSVEPALPPEERREPARREPAAKNG